MTSFRSYRSNVFYDICKRFGTFLRLGEVAGLRWVHVPPPLRIRESVTNNTTQTDLNCQLDELNFTNPLWNNDHIMLYYENVKAYNLLYYLRAGGVF